jgi:hypothetical protein
MPNAHIYPLSRLVHAGPRAWQRMLTEIEEGTSYASRYYLPMREAVVRLTASRGRNPDAIVAEIKSQIREAGGKHWANRLRDNVNAFETFRSDFLPRIARFRQSFLRERKDGCEFEGLTLSGAPHFEVVDSSGKIRHVFLHVAKWSSKDLAAYLELLALIVEKEYGGDPATLWVMDLRQGEDFKWRANAGMRRRCKDTAVLYGRFLTAMGNS